MRRSALRNEISKVMLVGCGVGLQVFGPANVANTIEGRALSNGVNISDGGTNTNIARLRVD